MPGAALPISLIELLRRTYRECIDDDCLGLAAQLSYYFFQSLFPALLFLLATASFFPLQNLTDDVAYALGPLVSAEVLRLIQEQLWFYLSGLAILAGAEFNAEIEHASPHGKQPSENSASGRRMIGRRAARVYNERQNSLIKAERGGRI